MSRSAVGLVALVCVSVFILGSTPAIANNSGWSALGDGVAIGNCGRNATVSALAVAPDGTLYVGGGFCLAGDTEAAMVAKWDGKEWSGLGSGISSNVYALALAEDGTLYAGGTFFDAGDLRVNDIAKWDGSAWSALGKGMDHWVNALAVASDGTLYAGGFFTTAGGATANRVAKWNGSRWSALGSGMSILDVSALAVAPNGTLYAGGYFETAGGQTVNSIAKWDGSAWSALGEGISYSTTPGTVYALAVTEDGTLYAGGDFDGAGGQSANNIAKWDGSGWSALGTGTNGTVKALSVAPDGTLYVGGEFDSVGGQSVYSVAKWDGSSWSALGEGMDGIVNALAVSPLGKVYAGGEFTQAGIVDVNHVAAWISPDTPTPTVPGAPTAITATAYDAKATVTFVAPASDGGSPITSYTVTSTPGNITAKGKKSPITITGLTNGTTYKFKVTATNAVGTGPASSESNPVTPTPAAKKPGKPTKVKAEADDAQATVSFVAPASNGGSPITSYTVTSSPGNITATGTSIPITVTGLTNGKSYKFTVKATNVVGTGPASSKSNKVTPVGVPGAPTAVKATAGKGTAKVTFKAPASNGGKAITSYTVTSSPGNITAKGKKSPITVKGLANGTAYTFTVAANNAVGTGPASSPSKPVTPKK